MRQLDRRPRTSCRRPHQCDLTSGQIGIIQISIIVTHNNDCFAFLFEDKRFSWIRLRRCLWVECLRVFRLVLRMQAFLFPFLVERYELVLALNSLERVPVEFPSIITGTIWMKREFSLSSRGRLSCAVIVSKISREATGGAANQICGILH